MLSPGQIDALRNLARKKAGDAVGWIDIEEARGLTELGLADRTRSGWQITADGEAALLAQDEPVVTNDNAVLTFPVPPARPTER